MDNSQRSSLSLCVPVRPFVLGLDLQPRELLEHILDKQKQGSKPMLEPLESTLGGVLVLYKHRSQIGPYE
jgi:hypothetical protein